MLPAGSEAEPPPNLRDLGRVRILEVLLDGRPVSRTELARRSGLARATVQSLVADLVQAGLISETEAVPAPGPGRTGRPVYPLTIVPDAAWVIGIDVGHDNVRTRLFDLSGRLVWDRRAELAVDEHAEAALAVAEAQVGAALNETDTDVDDVLGIGLAIACPVDDTGGLRATGIMPSWVGRHPALELAAATGVPVHLINDADAGLLGERRYGAARHCDNVIYLRLSSGVGSGAVCDGHVVGGHAGLAGELGHVVVTGTGACRCGQSGCLETVAGTAALTAALGRATGTTPTTEQLIAAVHAQDPAAVAIVARVGDLIGRVLALSVAVLNPRLVVVGGELAAAGPVLLDALRDAVLRTTMTALAQDLEIRSGALGDAAVGHGAAALVLSRAARVLALRAGG